MAELSDLELLNALGVEAEAKKKPKLTPKQERIIAGFEEVQRFVDLKGHLPHHGEDRDIFERLYATRLDQIRKLPECRELVSELDTQGLLEGADTEQDDVYLEEINDKELLAHLGVAAIENSDIAELKHVKTQAEKNKERAKADTIGTREPCKDFERFKPLFEEIQEDLNTGRRKTLPFDKDGSIEEGNWFILSGQKAFIASIGEEFKGKDGRNEYRLRVIFDNGVESNQLMRSIQKRLWEDKTGRRISDTRYGPLFDEAVNEDDNESGTIYILRSKSELPVIVENREVIHKIGVTGGSIKKRIANAALDPTYLMAEVEVVASYELFNINRQKLEKLLHRFFEPSRLDVAVKDRFGNPVKPKEWFLVPLFVIDEVVEKIRDGSITSYKYDRENAALVKDC